MTPRTVLLAAILAALSLTGCYTRPGGASGPAGVGTRTAGASNQSKQDRVDFNGSVTFAGPVTINGGDLNLGSIGGQASTIRDTYQEASKATDALSGNNAAVTGTGTSSATGDPTSSAGTPAKTEPAPPPADHEAVNALSAALQAERDRAAAAEARATEAEALLDAATAPAPEE